jgi:hypothetical protein
MSLHSFSFSHRATERKLRLQDIKDHQFIFDVKMLDHMFSSPSLFVEFGGTHGLSYALRTDTQGGLRDDEIEGNEGYKIRKGLYGVNQFPLPPVKPFFHHVCQSSK